MARLIEQKCCDKCRHEAANPCPDFVACLIDGPICHGDGVSGTDCEGASGKTASRSIGSIGACSELRTSRMAEYRRDVVARPVVFVGAGTCELGAGAGQTLAAVKRYLAEKQVDADVVEVGCIGLCAYEPLMDVQLPGRTRVSFHSVTEDKVYGILDSVFAGEIPAEWALGQFRPAPAAGNRSNEQEGARPAPAAGNRSNEIQDSPLPQPAGTGEYEIRPYADQEPWEGVPYLDEHPFLAKQTRWVLANCGVIDPGSIEEYMAFGGYRAFASTIKETTPEQLCNQVEESGLRGRGGGGFPAAKKWKIALNADGEQKYFVCNADEGDPGAFMDRAVIEGDPHRLIEGLAIAAYAIGATKAYIYIRAEYPLAIERLKKAIADATEYGLLGENILDSGFGLDIKLKMGAGAFVCGEETALIRSIEGKRGMPRPRPPFPAVQGLFGKPTIINNVETLANLPGLISNGAKWFSSVGTENSKGTKVFALSGKVERTGLVEAPMGMTLREIVFDIGGGIPNGREFKAVQIGGPSGGCIPTEHLDIEIDYESLKAVGAMMGSGGLVVMDDQTCMVDMAKYFMDFIQRESCGKCIPCREGTKRMLEILQRITRSTKSESGTDALHRFQGVIYMNRLAEVIRDTSLCGLGQTAANPVLSTLHWFRDEYESHIYDRRCPAGACTELLTYTIDKDACKGCTLCARQCPAEAIMGTAKSPHYIIPDKCIGCGNCLTACRLNAVVVN